MKAKDKRKEKQGALFKVWLIYSQFLATLIARDGNSYIYSSCLLK
jgi:hypothetical protein